MAAPDPDDLSTWQFDLPPDLIASRPPESRDGSRLLVIERRTGTIHHSWIRRITDWLRPGDVLVFNNTRVLPARLFGYRTQTGGRWEGLYVSEVAPGVWQMLCETRGKLVPGETITLVPASKWQTSGSPEFSQAPEASSELSGTTPGISRLTFRERCADGTWLMSCSTDRSTMSVLEEFGTLPLPPYMDRRIADEADRIRYQTAFATEPGAVAAPTAGLHFSDTLLQACRRQNIHTAELTLHVGIGTFRPISVQKLSEHRMHEEWCRLPAECCERLNTVRAQGGRTVAVGTTSVRTLESAILAEGLPLKPWEGRTRLFIQPGFPFQGTDCLLTNFHLPGSTLIVLVAAFAGYDLIMEAYRTAIEHRYRFYSYGDAMLIV